VAPPTMQMLGAALLLWLVAAGALTGLAGKGGAHPAPSLRACIGRASGAAGAAGAAAQLRLRGGANAAEVAGAGDHEKERGGASSAGGTDESAWTPPAHLRRPFGSPGENLRMGNDEAVRRFKAGACVLTLDFPAETEFGIDVRSWTVGPKFKGLKMVPAGIHLLHWDAVLCRVYGCARSACKHHLRMRIRTPVPHSHLHPHPHTHTDAYSRADTHVLPPSLPPLLPSHPRTQGHGMTQGMWFHAQPAQVLVLQWDASIEDFGVCVCVCVCVCTCIHIF